ncbi:MAG: XRE family transcriptional regulator [Gallionella sp.]|jgi:Zn-dependent peptidase ImmA (M78 family)/DNA-binding XRE family transcriptional regulator
MNAIKRYVRSQDGISEFREGATGLQLTRKQIEATLSSSKLFHLDENGSVPISDDFDVCSFFKERRESLGLAIDDLANIAKISAKSIEDIENSGTRSPARLMVKVAQMLSIPDAMLVGASKRVDADLALRLKEKIGCHVDTLPSKDVAIISEAAWVIRTEFELKTLLGKSEGLVGRFAKKDNDYGEPAHPVWVKARLLASKTRQLIGLTNDEPIKSVRSLLEETLGIPLIQTSFNKKIAGVTISNDDHRGVLVNNNGDNGQNIFVLRMTLAHELGHLLWDDEQHLNHFLIDNYNEIELLNDESGYYVEARANAFAAEFLAPQAAVLKIYKQNNSVRQVMDYFGISFTCAKLQIWNALKRNIPIESLSVDNVLSTDAWDAAENYSTDFLWDESIRSSRKGVFAKLVVECEQRELITSDSAASYLDCTIEVYQKQKNIIISLFES